MKTFLIADNYERFPHKEMVTWWNIADSALTNAGKPFFIPERYPEVECAVSFAVKICRLGKTIAVKFAHRYYSHFVPAIHFSLPSLKCQLLGMGQPIDPAISFDKSLVLADPISAIEFDTTTPITLFKNGIPQAVFQLSKMYRTIDEIISIISEMNTLKMGDIIVPALSIPVNLSQNDRLELNQADTTLLTVKIK